MDGNRDIFSERKKRITVCLWVLALGVFLIAIAITESRGEETITDTLFEAVTMDGEAVDIGEIQVRRTQIKMESVNFSINEVDQYIKYYDDKKDEIQTFIDELKNLRNNILREAKKIKLRNPIKPEG